MLDYKFCTNENEASLHARFMHVSYRLCPGAATEVGEEAEETADGEDYRAGDEDGREGCRVGQ